MAPPWSAVADLLVPPRCAGCAVPCRGAWCPRCADRLASLALADGARLELAEGVRAVGAYPHEDLAREVLLAAKLRGRHAALPAMAALLRHRLELPPPGEEVGWTWIPSGSRSQRRRGLDVPARLAGPGAVRLLAPIRGRARQTGRDAHGRRRGARDRFRVIGRPPPAVVCVDDVRTTGSTARAAGLTLRAAGAQRVLVATFTVRRDPAQRAG